MMGQVEAAKVHNGKFIAEGQSEALTFDDGDACAEPSTESTIATDETLTSDAACSPSSVAFNHSPAAVSVGLSSETVRLNDRPSSFESFGMKKLVCIGAGYVGAPTSIIMAMKSPSLQVVVVDLNQDRIDAFSKNSPPFYEPGLADLLPQSNLSFSTDCEAHIKEADIVFVSVNTPTKKSGLGSGLASDLSMWEAVGRTIAKAAEGYTIVVEKSTVPVRTAAALRRVIECNQRPEASFDILSNPEFLAEGTAVHDLLFPDRVLIGGQSEKAIAILSELYAQWVPRQRICTTNLWSAELSKLAANAMLAQRIVSINSFAAIAELTGGDVDEISRAVGMDSRIGPKFLQASPGFGGSCFRKDILNLVYISESLNLPEVAAYWRSVVEMNQWGIKRFANQVVKKSFGSVRGKYIALFGFAFKKDTGDVRESPGAIVLATLLADGASLRVHDPMVSEESVRAEMLDQQLTPSLQDFAVLEKEGRVTLTKKPEEACAGADAIVLVTDWDQFRSYDYAQLYKIMRRPALIFDGRRSLDGPALLALGFDYQALGRSVGNSADLRPSLFI